MRVSRVACLWGAVFDCLGGAAHTRHTRGIVEMYDSEAEIAQAKRDCVALAEEVQRLRGEVQRERTGRKKAMAAKKIAGMQNRSSRCQVLTKFLSATFSADEQRDDAVAALAKANAELKRKNGSGVVGGSLGALRAEGAAEEGVPRSVAAVPEGVPRSSAAGWGGAPKASSSQRR